VKKLILQKRKYKGIDALRIPFKAAPFFVVVQLSIAFVHALLFTVVLALSTAWFVDTAIDIFAQEAAANAIYLPFAVLLAAIGFGSIIGNLPRIFEARIKFALERKLTPAFLDIRAGFNYKHIENAESWELIERVAKEPIKNIQEAVRAYGMLIRCIVSIAAILGLIITQVWWAVIVIAAFSVPLIGIALWAGKKSYDAEVETRKYNRRHEYYTEVLTSREAVEERTLFGYGENVNDRFLEQWETARKIEFWVDVKMWIAMKSSGIAMAAISVLVALTLINPVISDDLSPGMFMGVVAAVFGLVNMLGWNMQDATEKIAKSKEYMKDLTAFMELSQAEGAKDLPDDEPPAFESLEFKNVRFKYPTSENYTLDGLSLKLEKGKHYAVVGANGAGKTTTTKLLTGLYDEYEGEILLNGKELRTFEASAVKSMFSVVYQDFARYQISMAQNIAIGDAARDIAEENIKRVASKIELNETIADLKDGINTPLGKIIEGGADLSGGQWQKIAIARSLISRAPIKILDEPTAALDPIAESRVYGEFEELMRGKTTIFISHRLGSTKLADEILVIKDGAIAENGSHNELMKLGGIYAEMFEAQRKWYE